MTLFNVFEDEAHKIVLEEIERVKNAIGNGQCEDYASYRQQVGFLAGLAKLKYVLDEASKTIQNR